MRALRPFLHISGPFRGLRVLARVALTGVALFAAYAVLLCTPQPFFPYSMQADNLILLGTKTSVVCLVFSGCYFSALLS